MPYQITMDQKSPYLHFTITGQITKENILDYMKRILRECTARRCSHALIEDRLEGPRLGTFDLFDIASEGSRAALGKLKAVAFVDRNAEDKQIKFAETVAVNRALNVTIFSTVANADQWLLKEISKYTPDLAPQASPDHSQ